MINRAFKCSPASARQLQDLTKEHPYDYVKRGGLTHFRGTTIGLPVCGSRVGASVRRWDHANCIDCFRARKMVRKAIGK